MANDIVAFRLPPEEKHALKVLSAEADMTLTDYVLYILRTNTALQQRAHELAKTVPQERKFISLKSEARPANVG